MQLLGLEPAYCHALTRLTPSRNVSYLSQWDANLERCLGSLEPVDTEEIRTITGSQHIRDFMAALLQTNDTQPIKHAAAMILPSLDHFEIFDAFLVTSLRPSLVTFPTWGMLYLMIKVR